MNKYVEGFRELVTSPEIVALSTDTIQNVINEHTDIEVLREVPVIASLLGILNMYNSYVDRIFQEKAFTVLLELRETSDVQRQAFLKELQTRKSSGIESLLMSIERLENLEKAEVFGRLCMLRINRDIDIDEFKRLTKCLQDCFLDDLYLIEEFEKYDGQEIEESDWLPLLSLNLIQRSSLEQFHYRDYGSERHEPMDEMRWRQRYFFTDIGGCLLNNFEKLLPKK
jgi:hypothetical protein